MSIAANKADANTITATPSTSPQSQLAGLTGQVHTINPQGDTARFVLADVRGKDAASAYRLSVIRTAVLELLKGNPRNLKEAIALTAELGKGKKARAYAAGFAVLADVQAIERTGKWTDTHNADIRTHADAMADAYTVQFSSAHATVMAEKPTPKAKKATPAEPAAPAADASDTSADDSTADTGSVNMELSISELVESAVTAIQQGMLSAEELVLIRAALAGIEETADMGLIASMGAASPLLMAQAH